MRLLHPFRLLCLAMFTSSCCAAAGTEYYIELLGSAPANIAGTGSSDAQVTAALTALVDGRAYGPGTYIYYGGCSGPDDQSKIVPGATYTYLPATQGSRLTGGGVRQSGRYVLTFTLPEGELILDSDYNRAQGVINETNKPGGPTVSVSTVVAKGIFVGTLDGQAVNLNFEQELHAERGGFGYGY